VIWAAFLRAYYRHVATEDLASFGPGQMAAVAAQHAALAGQRPQGRALVRVADAAPETTGGQAPGGSGGQAPAIAAFGPVRTVVDIVTDDMPYLVDSVTMELNRHQADISLILHPRLAVRRDVAGGLHAVTVPVNGAAGDSVPGELAESWMHIEIAGLGDRVPRSELEADLRRVLDDVRVTVEDQPKMTAAAASLAVSLDGDTGAPQPAPLPGRIEPQALDQPGPGSGCPAPLAGRRALHLPRLPRV